MLYHIRQLMENSSLIEVKEIKDLVREYVDKTVSPDLRCHREWPLIAGDNLRRVTSFARMDGNTICIYAKGSSARTRVMLEKRRIISDFNKRFPDMMADDIRILRLQ